MNVKYFFWRYKYSLLVILLSLIIFLDESKLKQSVYHVGMMILSLTLFWVGAILFLGLTRVYGFLYPLSIRSFLFKLNLLLFEKNQNLQGVLLEKKYLIERAKIRIESIQKWKNFHSNQTLLQLLCSSSEMFKKAFRSLLYREEGLPISEWQGLTSQEGKGTMALFTLPVKIDTSPDIESKKIKDLQK